MTKKDFEVVASALHSARPERPKHQALLPAYLAARDQWERCCEYLAVSLASTNPRFNRDRFFTACGYDRPDGTAANWDMRTGTPKAAE